MFIFRPVTLCLLFLVSFCFSGRDQKLYTISGFAQGTGYSLSYYSYSPKVSKTQIDSILLMIDSSMSLYKPHSLINQFNKSSKGIQIDQDFYTVVKKSFGIFKETQGRFDITVAPLVQIWGFGPQPVSAFPDSITVCKTLKHVGMKYLRLAGNTLYKSDPQVQIDLNGIAQGYSVDVVAAFLDREGVKSYIVEIGGEVVVKGPKPDGSGYKVGMEGGHIVALKKGAITTSGNYSRTLKYKMENISHLINPQTGYPLNGHMLSVTVYAKDAITADGYDNALMAMDISAAMAFVSAKKDLEAYFIYRKPDGSIADTLSAGFKKLLVK